VSSNDLLEMGSTILPWLGRTAKAMDYFMADYFESNGIKLTKAQMIALRVLSEHDGIIQNKLAFITNRDKASLTRLIDTMEKKKLVKRMIKEDDKRNKLVFITDEGKNTLQNAIPILKNIIKKVQENITIKDLDITINVLQQISENINADELTTPLKLK
jgi:DNA-binding MarR family transcriptional regulator